MPGIKMTFGEDPSALGRKLKVTVKKFGERQTLAIQAAAKRGAAEIESEGRADIARGGKFSTARWQEGFRALVSYKSRSDLRIRVTHHVFYWKVFEYGATILGRPLLWIPLSFGDAKGADGKGVRARDYPGQLFRVNRKGKNPLLMSDTGPQYVGVESVTIPKKWHLREITKRVSRNLGKYYREAMRNGK